MCAHAALVGSACARNIERKSVLKSLNALELQLPSDILSLSQQLLVKIRSQLPTERIRQALQFGVQLSSLIANLRNRQPTNKEAAALLVSAAALDALLPLSVLLSGLQFTQTASFFQRPWSYIGYLFVSASHDAMLQWL